MKSNRAKVLHEVMAVPMLHHVLHAIAPLHPERTLVVVGHQQDAVEATLAGFEVDSVVQEQQRGTGDAVLAAERSLTGSDWTVLILCGDTPLIRPQTLGDMYTAHQESGAAVTLMTTILDNPTNYGRILHGADGKITAIIEEKDATTEQRAIREINAGIYLTDSRFLFQTLHQVGTDNSQGEVYLTDLISLAVADGRSVHGFTAPHPGDVLGVNSRIELAEAHRELQSRRNRDLMLQGVTMLSPETTFVSYEAVINADTVLHPGTQIRGATRIGRFCHIEPGVILDDCLLQDEVRIGAYSCLSDCKLETRAVIAPHTTLSGFKQSTP
ncbi:bifunctional UDP-N-acetylglucosamine pyrophosphorylase/glucosamine-1-phosphate N-acetyltransferase [Desulfoprunum benzoelyticum]|uniref:Bifunctional UDP-N-acetylglucosamine pyrophosphorylase/glucosamine-1-phosphate N-acetyltransferase n=2 Tax=Desulfoprunum benzoelyticum TaxID=1506996 RepID=A0A840V016_9BACT|nr:bifunctional UDP-N-acetylglucosamine pyrophosphorylase/glucosamine-1-phosphate N-acetyltransferase [Desulfoprunum benzoelyticum]